jgi:futalosine hydrolase
MPLAEFVVVHPSRLESPAVAPELEFEIGVGKVAATMGLYSLLCNLETRRRVAAVLLVGIAGAVPAGIRGNPPPVAKGRLCVVGQDVLADEGVATPAGFVDFGAAGKKHLLDTGPYPASPRLAQDAAQHLGVPIVRGATVSTCSGTDAQARAIWQRTHADIETMEGAAIAAVCRRRELPLLQLRAISNWTGDRDEAQWNIGAALDTLRQALQSLFA